MQQNIDIQTKKIDIIQWLSTTEDEVMLDKVSDLIITERKKDWWLLSTEGEKKSIGKGINDAENGKLNPHKKAREVYGKWL